MTTKEALNEVLSYLVDQRIGEALANGDLEGEITGKEAFGAMVFAGIVAEKVRKLRDNN